ncbi:CRISPR-associated nuclease/helicase Cas3 subtype I-F/YPEST [Marinomonas spartinae]|uniref:CRISPR-associated nuclease/helicase Cas3 subtype I-F/YPEST n=1 Tax=Marinomonas spartinae TaxID=1792290 RepID=A0A1A8T9B3_9GAMM|nr:type I-F CRISPR-associated helicase Cas3f [Marinomonas spartinae]SBS28174.1 CRISPR-associated nuclease/helicase Cas3 subtype I-F/YPEST [Marinomonas spartinae]
MMVTFVSQCEKNSLKKTRRVLDAFANRIGDNTWQTLITEDGLLTVKKMLRQTASKNTAVSCHWIRTRARSELLWVVGNKNKFNEQGIVPVNYTEGDIGQFMDKEKWQSLAVMKNAVAIAALFHDFGKANILFQQKLKGEGKNKYEPVRHEWVSLRVFQAFVGDKTDEQWLIALTEIDKNHSDDIYQDGINDGRNNPLVNLPPFAQLVGWLILSHHKLPFVPSWKKTLTPETSPAILHKNGVSPLNSWFAEELQVFWNSYNFKNEDSQSFLHDNWTFHSEGLPYKSTKWRLRAIEAADKALQNVKQLSAKSLLHDELFTSHLARMALMLADHHYSAQKETTPEWQSPNYNVFANTDRDTKALKQQLDEHLIGVAKHAVDIVGALPQLKGSLQALEDNEFLKSTKADDKYAWQIAAQKVALDISESSKKQGFFGINMASTGKGKTLANAKIMYALASKEQDCRFTVALGLRTLTLQTGREYRKQLDLTAEQLAIAVGGSASKALFENEQHKKAPDESFGTGSESVEDFLDPDLYVDYDLSGVEHSLHSWTGANPRIEKLVQAPALVCTIDHLIPSTDGTKGGKQIGPMLRLLTSDLVIDEPDDFGLEDLPALCRLVYWAGMLGSRVLLSTATMPPDLAFAAFQAYQAGWAEYAKVNIAEWNKSVNCAWFDERPKGGAHKAEVREFSSFKEQHEKYVKKREEYLSYGLEKHKAEILDNLTRTDNIYVNFAQTIMQGALALHKNNHVKLDDKQVSIGLVRMANINPMVVVTKALLNLPAPENTHIHLCVYHSRYPLAVRSYLEGELDQILNRKENWPPQNLQNLVNKTAAKNQLFIVLASPVAEVGRDHDYDWAIIEPSSMRSIIQIAGRVLRHRDQVPEQENILLINQNIKQLKGCERCFNQPGFEVENLKLKLNKHTLREVLDKSQYQSINAVERVIKSKQPPLENLVSLEHEALSRKVNERSLTAFWWKEQAHWCGVLQNLQVFRKSAKDEALYLLYKNNELMWEWKNEAVFSPKMGALSGAGISIKEEPAIMPAEGISFWFDLNPHRIYAELANDFNTSEEEASQLFGELRLVSYKKNDINEYRYFSNLGIYQEVQ